jgi:hypothetical protein
MVKAAEATAKAMDVSSVVKVYPFTGTVGYWQSLGYLPDASTSRVLKKRL